MNAQNISRLAAIGITIILWPVCFVGEVLLIWMLANPSWLTGAGRGLGNGAPESANYLPYLYVGGMILSSLLLAACFSWIISKVRGRAGNGISKRTAIGISAVFWPIISFAGLALTKYFIPQLFSFVSNGPPDVVSERLRMHNMELYLTLGLMLFCSLGASALLGWLLYGNGKSVEIGAQ